MMMKQYEEMLCNREMQVQAAGGLRGQEVSDTHNCQEEGAAQQVFEQCIREVRIRLKKSLKNIKNMEAALAGE